MLEPGQGAAGKALGVGGRLESSRESSGCPGQIGDQQGRGTKLESDSSKPGPGGYRTQMKAKRDWGEKVEAAVHNGVPREQRGKRAAKIEERRQKEIGIRGKADTVAQRQGSQELKWGTEGDS